MGGVALDTGSCPTGRSTDGPGARSPRAVRRPDDLDAPGRAAGAGRGRVRSSARRPPSTHTFVGDLRVELVAPSGQVAVLHDQSGGSADNLIRSYDSSGTAALASMVGQPVEGMWRLRVKDLVGQDVGKLNRWRLELTI